MNISTVYSGVQKITFGKPESITPVSLRNIEADMANAKNLPEALDLPFDLNEIKFKTTARGCVVELPLVEGEDVHGLGLQLKSHCQTGKKKVLRVNSDPVADTGDSHAPVPFYLSTNGYGVFVDTARYTTFYCGSHQRRQDSQASFDSCQNENIGTSTEELYDSKKNTSSSMMIEIPSVQGIDLYIFAGPNMQVALQRYVMFSGGGCLPPMWGLGVLYRGYAKNNQDDSVKLAKHFREKHIPCDVFGLEPGWMDKSYSCNFAWNDTNFPDTDTFLNQMYDMGYELNLWEQLFVHPTASFYKDMQPYSGDFDVWEGLVPDLSMSEARDIYSKHQFDNFIQRGIHGVKVDECDNSDFIRFPWSFPETSEFPSGMDGEQMHSSFGRLGQEAIMQGFRKANKRTYSNCRSSHALASPYPMAVYSDLYDHDDFIRGTVNASLSGLLWTPEVRRCKSVDDLIRRIQSVVFSPMTLVNAWTIKNPPWLQFDETKNNQDILLDNATEVEAICKELFELRMSLLPYLYSAFAKYRFSGLPVFRALVVDYPEDLAVRDLDTQYMVGDSLMFAPLTAGNTQREVYFPQGKWVDFFSHQIYEGGQAYQLKADVNQLLLFVKHNTLLPFAKPVEHITKDICFDITVRVYGDTPQSCELFSDDGYSFDYENGQYDKLILNWDTINGGSSTVLSNDKSLSKYNITDWQKKY